MNLQPLHQKIILLFGETAREIYLLARDSTLGRIKLNQKTWLKWCEYEMLVQILHFWEFLLKYDFSYTGGYRLS